MEEKNNSAKANTESSPPKPSGSGTQHSSQNKRQGSSRKNNSRPRSSDRRGPSTSRDANENKNRRQRSPQRPGTHDNRGYRHNNRQFRWRRWQRDRSPSVDDNNYRNRRNSRRREGGRRHDQPENISPDIPLQHNPNIDRQTLQTAFGVIQSFVNKFLPQAVLETLDIGSVANLSEINIPQNLPAPETSVRRQVGIINPEVDLSLPSNQREKSNTEITFDVKQKSPTKINSEPDQPHSSFLLKNSYETAESDSIVKEEFEISEPYHYPDEYEPNTGTPANKENFIITELNLITPHETNNSTDTSTVTTPAANRPASTPLISIVPLSRLTNSNKDTSPSPTREKITAKPNLVQRKRKPDNNPLTQESISEHIVQKVVNMGKVSIKNIINSEDTKFDAALKMKARRRVREEIREQLNSIELVAPKTNQIPEIIPDEVVNANDIPMLAEIRSALGLDMFDTLNQSLTEPNPSTPSGSVTQELPLPSAQESSHIPSQKSKSPDLMTRLKILEDTKTQNEKIAAGSTNNTPKKRREKRKANRDETVVVISSSSSSSTSSGSESDSSSSSTSSHASQKSHRERRQKRRNLLQNKVIGNFEQLVLPRLSERQRRSYADKYSKTLKTTLLYVFNVCANRSISMLTPQERTKMKRNITKKDNVQALEFLSRAILNFLKLHKDKPLKPREKQILSTSETLNTFISKAANAVSHTRTSSNSSSRQTNDTPMPSVSEQNKSANSAAYIEQLRHQSAQMNQTARLISEGASGTACISGIGGIRASTGVNSNSENVIIESANSAQRGLGLADGSASNLAGAGGGFSRILPMNGQESNSDSENNMDTFIHSVNNHLAQIVCYKNLNVNENTIDCLMELDLKLEQLRQRKVHAEMMIHKHQQDKKEIESLSMKIQSQKFLLLLNSAMKVDTTNNPPGTSSRSENSSISTPLREEAASVSSDIRLRKRRWDIAKSGGADETSSASVGLENETEGEPRSAYKKRYQEPKEIPNQQPLYVEPRPSSTGFDVPENTQTSLTQCDNQIDQKPVVPIYDYQDIPNGKFDGWKEPIVQIRVVEDVLVAASLDGIIYKYDLFSRQLEATFSKHTQPITQLYVSIRNKHIYSTSLDGFLKKIGIEKFGLEVHSLNFQEPLNAIDIEWNIAFIGSRWGNIFTLNLAINDTPQSLCSSDLAITAIKATKEGPRKIIIVTSKGYRVDFRDAMDGLLLRSLEIEETYNIYNLILDEGQIYCGTQGNEILKYNFTTGTRMAKFKCGYGPAVIKIYKEKYLFAGCYDGLIHVIDKQTGRKIGEFPGSGGIITAIEIAGRKIITSCKDNKMQISDIPEDILKECV